MKTGKKIAVALAAALAIAIFAGGAVSMVGAEPEPEPDAEVTFTVDVRAFNVELDTIDTGFDTMVVGDDKEMHAFDLINPGLIPVLVEGKFSTGDGVLFGFVEEGVEKRVSVKVLPASNFQLNAVPFNDDGTPVVLEDVPGLETTSYQATLNVDAEQPEATYTGTIELIFTAGVL